MPAFRKQNAPEPPASQSQPDDQTIPPVPPVQNQADHLKEPGFFSYPGKILSLMYRIFFTFMLCYFALGIVTGPVFGFSYGASYEENYPEEASSEQYYDDSSLPVGQVATLTVPYIARNSRGDLFVSAEVKKPNTSQVFGGDVVVVDLSYNGGVFWSDLAEIPWLEGSTTSYPFSVVVSHDDLPDEISSADLSDIKASVQFGNDMTPDIPYEETPNSSMKAEIIENGISSQSGVVVYSLKAEYPDSDETVVPIITFYKDGTLVYARSDDEVDLYDELILSPEGLPCSFISEYPLPAYDEVKIILANAD